MPKEKPIETILECEACREPLHSRVLSEMVANAGMMMMNAGPGPIGHQPNGPYGAQPQFAGGVGMPYGGQ